MRRWAQMQNTSVADVRTLRIRHTQAQLAASGPEGQSAKRSQMAADLNAMKERSQKELDELAVRSSSLPPAPMLAVCRRTHQRACCRILRPPRKSTSYSASNTRRTKRAPIYLWVITAPCCVVMQPSNTNCATRTTSCKCAHRGSESSRQITRL